MRVSTRTVRRVVAAGAALALCSGELTAQNSGAPTLQETFESIRTTLASARSRQAGARLEWVNTHALRGALGCSLTIARRERSTRTGTNEVRDDAESVYVYDLTTFHSDVSVERSDSEFGSYYYLSFRRLDGGEVQLVYLDQREEIVRRLATDFTRAITLCGGKPSSSQNRSSAVGP